MVQFLGLGEESAGRSRTQTVAGGRAENGQGCAGTPLVRAVDLLVQAPGKGVGADRPDQQYGRRTPPLTPRASQVRGAVTKFHEAVAVAECRLSSNR